MTWKRFKRGVLKTFSFIRRYGWIILAGTAIVALFFLFRSAAARQLIDDMWSIIQRERLLHKEYVEELDAITEREREERRRASQRALNAVKAAEEQFRERNKELDKKKKREIERLVRDVGDDEEALSKRLAEEFGITYTSNV